MKKYKLIINILLLTIFIFCIIAFALICKMTATNWDYFIQVFIDWTDHPDYNIFLQDTLCLTFSIIFSILGAIASAVVFCLLNFKIWKKEN